MITPLFSTMMKKSRRKQRKDSGPTEPVTEEATTETHISTPSYDLPPSEVSLVDETQDRNNEDMLFDVHDDLKGEEVVVEKEIAKKEVITVDPVTTAGEGVTTANVEVTTASAPTTTINVLTLAQTLI
ncbi:hypothetical protein Tco_0244531, partial [Tanacetum coccineum]